MGDLKAVMKTHQHLPSVEMLTVLSQLLGNVIALQDCRVYTPEMVMSIVSSNIEIGNQVAVDMFGPKGSA